jgi:hypothetical protein
MKTSGNTLNSSLVMLSLTPNLHHFFVENGVRYQSFSFSEKVLSALIEVGILKGKRSVEEPAAPSHLMLWLKPALDAGIPVIEEAELMMWDASVGKWVEPTHDLISQSMAHHCQQDYSAFDEGDVLGFKIIEGKLEFVKLNGVTTSKGGELV